MRKAANEVFTVQEAAQLKQVDESSIRRALLQGRLAGIHRGRMWFIERRDLEKWTPERRGRKRQQDPAETAAERARAAKARRIREGLQRFAPLTASSEGFLAEKWAELEAERAQRAAETHG